MTPLRAASAIALLGAFCWAGVYGQHHYFPRGRLLPGLKVSGEVIPDDVARGDDAAIRAWIEAREAPLLDREVEVHAAASKRVVPLRSLLGADDVDGTIARLRAFGHEPQLAHRIDDALRARRGEIDVPLTVHVDPRVVEGLVGAMKAEVDEPPTDARLDLAAHATIADKSGHFLDFDGGVIALERTIEEHALDRDGAPALSVELATLVVPARVTAESLAALDIKTVVSSFETHFGRGGDQAPRAVNIETAAKKLDGLVLEPKALISFNQVVGERSEANGFKMAWEIFKGEMRPGVGGGTCQVASTFHAAAFFAGLDVLERLPHSRPSAYIPMGLDSTVVYPAVDLKLKNPYPYPLVVHTIVTGNTLRVELLGPEKPVSVAFARDTVAVLPFERRIDEEPYVKVGKAIKKQGGIRGYRIKRVRTLTPLTPNGGVETRVEETFDYYPPTTEIYVVAPGTDPNELPAMPSDVLEALAKKKGLDTRPEYASTTATNATNATGSTQDAVACAGDCEGQTAQAETTKPKLEVQTAAGVHEATGDQLAPAPKVILKQ